jgi:hypothetical protein
VIASNEATARANRILPIAVLVLTVVLTLCREPRYSDRSASMGLRRDAFQAG